MDNNEKDKNLSTNNDEIVDSENAQINENAASRAELEVEENKIKIISPGRMVLKRFFRSRLSVIGLVTLVVLFAFAIFGPFFSPWGETEADLRPTPPMVHDTPISYTEKIDNDKDILEAANALKGELTGYQEVNYDTDSSLQIATKIKNNKEALYEAFKNNVNDDNKDDVLRFSRATGQEIIFEVVFDAGSYHFFLMQEDENSASGYSRITTSIVQRSRDSKTLNNNDTPTKDHWLGTDEGAYDVFTRLMYGGRISLTLGFVVVFISTFIGIFMGGIAGYFGKWLDLIIMRIIDIIYCLPTLPIMLIVSAILDGMEIDEGIRIYFLMGILSLLGWAGVARAVRGQILALREQEFMVAAEALGIGVPRRIVKHLVPNIMPILIVSMTLALGSTILTEATLSFLGLGIRMPKAAWGTMISKANENPLILQYYPNQWVPAGVMIILAVLAFNFVGDGLRDAFDPKMKR